MDNYEISLGEDNPWLILQRGRNALDEIEQTRSARLNMNSVSNASKTSFLLFSSVFFSIELPFCQ